MRGIDVLNLAHIALHALADDPDTAILADQVADAVADVEGLIAALSEFGGIDEPCTPGASQRLVRLRAAYARLVSP